MSRTPEPDWDALAQEGIPEAMTAAAAIVAGKWHSSVSRLAEFDDLLQDARVLVATRFAVKARTDPPGWVKQSLVWALGDQVRAR